VTLAHEAIFGAAIMLALDKQKKLLMQCSEIQAKLLLTRMRSHASSNNAQQEERSRLGYLPEFLAK
jgi:hypothetical protein